MTLSVTLEEGHAREELEMNRAKLPFSVFKRPTKKKNRNIYYVKFRDESGEYTTAVSPTKTGKADTIN